ncbi:hypothetical protein AN935_21210 [Bacillus inaquosorum]|nr:hypothetical protein AN935_21210 [Bacillus inaquosorum]
MRFEIVVQADDIKADRFIDDVKLGADCPGREHLPNGGIESKARVFCTAVLLCHAERVMVPEAQVHKRMVLDHLVMDALHRLAAFVLFEGCPKRLVALDQLFESPVQPFGVKLPFQL